MEQSKLRLWNGLVAFVVLLVGLVFCAFLQYTLGSVGFVLTELFVAAIAIAAAFIFRAKRREFFPLAKPRLKHIIGGIILWFGTWMLTLALVNATAIIFPIVMELNNELSDFLFADGFFMALVMGAVMAGICEELFFRGFLLATMNRFKGDWTKILLCGFLFGVFHLDPYRFLPTAILGCTLTLVAIRSGNIILPIGLHFLHNFITFVISYGAIKALETSPELAEQVAAQAAADSTSQWLGVIALFLFSLGPLAIGLFTMRKPKTNLSASERMLNSSDNDF
jgi:membrane protease YdiL (CAAX protease family)